VKKHFILIGYGDVGMSIASVLEKANVSFVVVDKNEAKFKDKYFKYVAGDATDEEVLKRADLKNATSVIIVLNNDTDIIFTSLIARTLNTHCIIIARANATKSIDKIYRAGADYVASLSIVAAQMLARGGHGILRWVVSTLTTWNTFNHRVVVGVVKEHQ